MSVPECPPWLGPGGHVMVHWWVLDAGLEVVGSEDWQGYADLGATVAALARHADSAVEGHRQACLLLSEVLLLSQP